MRTKTFLATALVLSGSLGIGCQLMRDQAGSRSAATPTSGQSVSRGAEQKLTGRISQADMRKVEEALTAKGYDPGAVDGKADQQTQRALREFQNKNNLEATGNIDPATAKSPGIVIVFLE